jgi:hypothetical protein
MDELLPTHDLLHSNHAFSCHGPSAAPKAKGDSCSSSLINYSHTTGQKLFLVIFPRLAYPTPFCFQTLNSLSDRQHWHPPLSQQRKSSTLFYTWQWFSCSGMWRPRGVEPPLHGLLEAYQATLTMPKSMRDYMRTRSTVFGIYMERVAGHHLFWMDQPKTFVFVHWRRLND